MRSPAIAQRREGMRGGGPLQSAVLVLPPFHHPGGGQSSITPLTSRFVADRKTDQAGRFEHYRLITDAEGKPVKLGEGAMGVTYLAEDANLRVKVALKVIAPSLLGDTEIVQRFQREAQAAARLRHPHVAAVYHLGTVDDTFFYTMEFVEGRTLREHVAESGPLNI